MKIAISTVSLLANFPENHKAVRRWLADSMGADLQAVPHDERSDGLRCELLAKIGAGKSTSVHVGRATSSAGIKHLVAVKRQRENLKRDPRVQRMLATEASLTSRFKHRNVVAVKDFERVDSQLLLIMEYVEGASLAELLMLGARKGIALPSSVTIRIALDACAGLVAAHECGSVLHCNMSLQSILVGMDGIARVTDFSLAKHMSAALDDSGGMLQEELACRPPEGLDSEAVSVQTDVLTMIAVLWKALANRRRDDEAVRAVLDSMVHRHHATMRELYEALEGVASRHNLIATHSEVSHYVRSISGAALEQRREFIRTLGQDDASRPDRREMGSTDPDVGREQSPHRQKSGIHPIGYSDEVDEDDDSDDVITQVYRPNCFRQGGNDDGHVERTLPSLTHGKSSRPSERHLAAG